MSTVRPRHVASAPAQQQQQADSGIRLKQQQLERALLRLESLVHPELYAKMTTSTSKSPGERTALRDEISRGIKEMEALVPGERDPAKRELAKRRVEIFTQRLGDLDASASSKKKAYYGGGDDDKWAAQSRERGELLSGFDPEAASAGLSEAGQESTSLKHSHSAVDEVLQVGMSILTNLTDQRDGLRRATNRVESMTGSLGMSNSLLRAVRRRQFGDAMIVYGGMVLVLVLLYLFYWWVHR